MLFKARITAPLLAVLLCAACAAPGVTVTQSTALPAATTAATVVTSLPQPTSAPTVAATTPPTSAPTAAPTSAPTTAPTVAATAPAATAPAAQPSVASGEGTLVALGRDTTKASVLAGNTWSIVEPGFYEGTNDCDYGSVAVAADSTFWLSCQGNLVSSPDGETWSRVDGTSGNVLRAPDGTIWIYSSFEIRHYAGAAPTIYKPEETTKERVFPSNAAFAPNGTLWLTGDSPDVSNLVSFDGTTWKTYGTGIMPEGNQESPNLLLISTNGNVYTFAAGLVKLEGERFTQVLSRDDLRAQIGTAAPIIRAALAMPDGSVLAASDVGIIRLENNKLSLISRDAGLPSRDLFALARDDSGNVWAATSSGIAVQQGDKWQVAVPSTSDIADSRFSALAVRGAPQLPAANTEPKTTTIYGRVSRGSAPLTNAKIQLCSEIPSRAVFGSDPNAFDPATNTPCGNQFYSQLGTTDTQGNYRFEKVPIGMYELSLQTDDRWSSFYSSLNINALQPNTDVQFDLPLQ